MMQERRKYIRFKVPFCVSYKLKDREEEITGVTRDLSYGGSRLLLDSSLELLPKTYGSLRIVFPQETLNFSVKLIWSKKQADNKIEAGLSFINLPDSYKETLFRYIFKYAPQEFNQRWRNK
ncbi:MAG: PilZ domain-containing protein [Candidatus Omnitrophica bacterium]|nr:PilZ domain-containing protein [Candidatus Omnitrophota bacterium]